MKVYMVGGAVRDKLINYPIKERDWVVVGAVPDDLLKKGYRQVGKDFPVFLHPKTGEEYALARTERKSAPGYYGFTCDSSPGITLEEDLKRRDLTINAMAMDKNGHLIDPYHGKEDLDKKILRHVSESFIEDPVRVLRVARFAARYHHLGFSLSSETRQLMYQMVKNGELDHLVPERVWQECSQSLNEKNPEYFFSVLRECDALRVIFPEIFALYGVPNTLNYHPEVDSGIHTMMVLKAACDLSTDPMVRFAALVHDLGKARTPMTEWPKHKAHDTRGVPVIEQLCQRLKVPSDYRKFAMMVSDIHLNIHRLFELRSQTILNLLQKADAFRRPERFDKLLIACQADAWGTSRGKVEYKQLAQWRYILQECVKISAKDIKEQGFEGIVIKEELHRRRCAVISMIKQNWNTNEK